MKQLKQKKQAVEKSNKSAEPCQPSPKAFRSPHPCPVCGKMSQHNTYPFCSTRCRAIDLNRWLSGSYILPSPAVETDEEE